MSPDDPRHGTYAGRLAHKRDGEDPCGPCFLAARRAHKQRRHDAACGNPRMVPLGDDAWRIVSTVPLAVITRQTGIRAGKLSGYTEAGPSKRVRRSTRDRILSVQGWTVIGIQRRLRALTRVGWSMAALAPHVGLAQDTLRDIRSSDNRTFVRQEVAAAITDGYERLCMSRPIGRGAARARNTAAAQGWAPPLAWDDIDHDDAPAVPVKVANHEQQIDDVVVDRVVRGERRPRKLTSAESAAAVQRLVAMGLSTTVIETQYGFKVERYYRRSDVA